MKKLPWIFLLLFFASCATAPQAWHGSRHGLLDSYSDEGASAKDSAGEDSTQVNYSFKKHMENRAPAAQDVKYAKGVMHWPLKNVQVTSKFGSRGREFHEGVDLRAKPGTPVFAASDGIVLYAGTRIRGYGKLVIIKHRGGWSTVYAHNSQLFVRSGQHIQRGQRISLSGNTGHSSGPHLHFEIRRGIYAVDPLRVMPEIPYRVASRASLYARR